MRRAVTTEAGDRARRLFDMAPVGIAVVGVSGGQDGRIVDANPAFGRLLGRACDTVLGELVCELIHPDEHTEATRVLASLIAGATPSYEGDSRLLRAEGGSRWVRINARLLRDCDGDPEAILVHLADLTALRHQTDRQDDIARRLHDAQQLARIGTFEWLPASDSVLISDEVFRLFGLRPGSLPGALPAWEPMLHADDIPRLMHTLTATLTDGQERAVEFRFRPTDGTIRWAETRMCAERESGRTRRLLGTMQDIHERRLGEDQLRNEVEELEDVARLRLAIRDDRLRLDGQPIVDLRTGQTVMNEVLVRLVEEDGRVVPASGFLPMAEKHGLIGDLDCWVLGHAVDLAAAGIAIAVNVSARTMSDPRYRRRVIELLVDRGIEPSQLTFEVTETALIENFAHAERFATELASFGCRLALDDFGTGYGTFTYLKQLPAHFLKIDREFVRDADSNERSRAVIRGIIALAESFGQQTIAEGVESPEVLEILRELGADFAQGFYLARPEWIAGANPAAKPRE